MYDLKSFLKKTFDMDAENIQQIYGGMMNSSFHFVSNKRKYIIYFPTEQANAMVNRELEKENQSIFFKVKTTSRNVYFDTESGIKINEYIPGESLNNVKEYDIEKVAELLKKVHNSPLLSEKDYNPFLKLASFKDTLKNYKASLDNEYLKLEKYLLSNQDFLEKQSKVLCHNDFQKSNIIKSTSNEYFVIDFEFSGNNDPIYDIATFGNDDVYEGLKLLETYFSNPTSEQKQRYFLWRLYISLQWYVVAIYKHLSGEGKTHKIDFEKVAEHFIKNAEIAYQESIKIKL